MEGLLLEARVERLERIVVRHIGGERDLGEALLLSVPAMTERPSANSISLLRGLQQVGCDLACPSRPRGPTPWQAPHHRRRASASHRCPCRTARDRCRQRRCRCPRTSRRASRRRSARRSSRAPGRGCACRSAPSPGRWGARAPWHSRRGRRARRASPRCARAQGRTPRCRWTARCRAACPARRLSLAGAGSRHSRQRRAHAPCSRADRRCRTHHHRRLVREGLLRDHVAPADLGLVDAHLRWPRSRPGARPRRSPPAAPRRDRHRPARYW